jgi:hypothetical protein
MKAFEDSVLYGKHVGLKIASAVVVVFVSVFLLRQVFVGERVFRLDRPTPAREMDLVQDKATITKVANALIFHLNHSQADACGLSAVHLGYAYQILVMRPIRKGVWIVMVNPIAVSNVYASYSETTRTVGASDPLCAEHVDHVRRFPVADKIDVNDLLFSPAESRIAIARGEAQFEQNYGFVGSQARCFQQLMRTLNMTSAEDTPCVKTRGYERDANYLPLDVRQEL